MIIDAISKQLQDFIETRDRSSPLKFVGRDDELSFLNSLVSLVHRADAGNVPKGALRLIYGVPGTGKTSLKQEFINRLIQQDQQAHEQFTDKWLNQQSGANPVAERPVLCVPIGASHMAMDAKGLVRSITTQVLESQAAWLRKQPKWANVDLTTLLDGATRFFCRGATWQELDEKAHGLDAQSPLADCLNHYAQNIWAPGTTLVLLIDEAQGLKVHSENTIDNMEALFEGDHKARVATLCFGLSNSGQVLDDIGISRPVHDSDRQLGCFKPGEAQQVLHDTMDALRLRSGDHAWAGHLRSLGMEGEQWNAWRAKLVDRMADNAQDFPQHVAVGLMAVCDEVLKMKPHQAFNNALLDTIDANHLQRKADYYKVRLRSSALSDHKIALSVISKLFERTGGGPVDRDDAVRIIRMGSSQTAAPLDGKEAKAVLRGAINKGVFGADSDRADQLLPPPIPSMQAHLMDFLHQILQDNPKQNTLDMLALLDQMAPTPKKAAAAAPAATPPETRPDENSKLSP